jgi:hypothetical protein
MRQLKFHEKKLLKKVNFLQWKNEHNHREVEVIRRYHLQDRDDYKKYNNMCGMVTKLVNMLKQLDPRDPARLELTDNLLAKLYDMGVTPTKKSLGFNVVLLPPTAFRDHGPPQDGGNLARSGDFRGTRARSCWAGNGHRSGVPRNPELRGLRDLGGHVQN